MERHNVVEPALWRYGAVELTWLEKAVQFAPTLASEQHLTLVLADGGTVDITIAGEDATTLARVPDPAHSGNEQPQLSIPNKPIGETPIASSSLHVRCGDADHVGETPASLPQMPLVEPLRQAPNRFEAGDLTDALPPQSNTLIPGTAWLWRESATFVVTPRTPGRALIVRLPAEALIARLGSIADLDRRPLSCDQGSGAICFTLLVALIAQAPLLSHEQRQILGDCAFDAIVVWLRSEQTVRVGLSAHRRELLNAICAYIERYLDDDQLCPRTIANSFGISVRYLHALFTATGTTVAQWITIRRLETIRSELLLRGGERGCIRDVATRWGFHDLSHFSRVFRQHFGTPPLTYIRQRTRGHCTEP